MPTPLPEPSVTTMQLLNRSHFGSHHQYRSYVQSVAQRYLESIAEQTRIRYNAQFNYHPNYSIPDDYIMYSEMPPPDVLNRSIMVPVYLANLDGTPANIDKEKYQCANPNQKPILFPRFKYPADFNDIPPEERFLYIEPASTETILRESIPIFIFLGVLFGIFVLYCVCTNIPWSKFCRYLGHKMCGCCRKPAAVEMEVVGGDQADIELGPVGENGENGEAGQSQQTSAEGNNPDAGGNGGGGLTIDMIPNTPPTNNMTPPMDHHSNASTTFTTVATIEYNGGGGGETPPPKYETVAIWTATNQVDTIKLVNDGSNGNGNGNGSSSSSGSRIGVGVAGPSTSQAGTGASGGASGGGGNRILKKSPTEIFHDSISSFSTNSSEYGNENFKCFTL